MKSVPTFVALAAALSVGAAAARADSLAHTFYPGHGDPQNNFTVVNDTTDDIQLGLSAQQRGSSSPAPTGLSTNYFVLPSSSLTWNFDFAIDTNPDGSGALLLSNLTASIAVTGPGGLSGTYNPLFPINDNNGAPTPLTLAQNSENLSFDVLFEPPVGTGGPLGFNPSQAGTYTFTLTVDNAASGAPLASDTMTVTVVPLPSAAGMGLTLLGLVGGAALLRRKLRAA